MILQISGSLPSLSGMEMACDYGNNIRTVARVPGPAFGHQIAYCNLLPKDQFPPFPPHQGKLSVHWTVETALWGSSEAQPRRGVMVDLRHGGHVADSDVSGDPSTPLSFSPWIPWSIPDHVTVEMSVRVNGRNIVRANFTIYDCSRIGQVYPHTA